VEAPSTTVLDTAGTRNTEVRAAQRSTAVRHTGRSTTSVAVPVGVLPNCLGNHLCPQGIGENL